MKKPKTEEHKQKLSKALQGHIPTTKGKTLEEINGKEKAEDIKRKSKEANINKNVSEITRQKLSDKGKNRKFTREHCENIGKSNIGKHSKSKGKQSNDHIRKRSEAIRRKDLDDKIDEMFNLRLKGEFYKTIAKIYECSESFVISKLKNKEVK